MQSESSVSSSRSDGCESPLTRFFGTLVRSAVTLETMRDSACPRSETGLSVSRMARLSKTAAAWTDTSRSGVLPELSCMTVFMLRVAFEELRQHFRDGREQPFRIEGLHEPAGGSGRLALLLAFLGGFGGE